MSESRVIRACVRAAMLTNRNGTHKMTRIRISAVIKSDVTLECICLCYSKPPNCCDLTR